MWSSCISLSAWKWTLANKSTIPTSPSANKQALSWHFCTLYLSCVLVYTSSTQQEQTAMAVYVWCHGLISQLEMLQPLSDELLCKNPFFHGGGEGGKMWPSHCKYFPSDALGRLGGSPRASRGFCPCSFQSGELSLSSLGVWTHWGCTCRWWHVTHHPLDRQCQTRLTCLHHTLSFYGIVCVCACVRARARTCMYVRVVCQLTLSHLGQTLNHLFCEKQKHTHKQLMSPHFGGCASIFTVGPHSWRSLLFSF